MLSTIMDNDTTLLYLNLVCLLITKKGCKIGRSFSLQGFKQITWKNQVECYMKGMYVEITQVIDKGKTMMQNRICMIRFLPLWHWSKYV